MQKPSNDALSSMTKTRTHNRSSALHDLAANESHTRLRAARYLSKNATHEDLTVLKAAKRVETYSYVIEALDVGISRLSNTSVPETVSPNEEEPEIAQEIRKQAKSQATEWITGILLHEIAAPIGLVRRAAKQEIKDYENSQTKKRLDALNSVFNGIKQLRGATATPRPEQFDLSELISEMVLDIAEELRIPVGDQDDGIEVHQVGSKPMIINSDPDLVRIFLSNGIRNAFEAVRSIQLNESNLIVISWGQTDIDYWVSVIDKGTGIVGPSDSAFDIGKTTKKTEGHSGFGLAIARQAIETIQGEVSLEPAVQGGAKYEARWIK